MTTIDRCLHEDAVLAHLLDGEPTTADQAAFLADHLTLCPRCARVLAASRRLDGVVASVSGVDFVPVEAEQMLTDAYDEAMRRTALERQLEVLPTGPSDSAKMTPSPRRPIKHVLVAATLLATGFALARLWPESAAHRSDIGQDADPQAVARSSDTALDADPQTVAQSLPVGPKPVPPEPAPFVLRPNEVLLPSFESDLTKETSARRVPQPTTFARLSLPMSAGQTTVDPQFSIALLTQPDLIAPLSLSLALRAQILGLETPAAAAVRAPDLLAPLQRRAFESLLEGAVQNSENAFHAVCLHLAECKTSPSWVKPEQASHNAFRRALARRLSEQPRAHHVAAAARLVDPIVVKALRRHVDGQVERLDAVVASWRGLDNASPHLSTLLDLWIDVRRRGLRVDVDDVALAQRFVAPLQGALGSTFAQLGQSTVHAERRRLVFLCLAIRPDLSALPWLVSVLHGSRLEERLLAAYALGTFEPTTVREHLDQDPPRARHRALWTAVLLRAGDGSARQALRQWNLSFEERDWLLRGAFPPDQMAAVVALCESRPTTPL